MIRSAKFSLVVLLLALKEQMSSCSEEKRKSVFFIQPVHRKNIKNNKITKSNGHGNVHVLSFEVNVQCQFNFVETPRKSIIANVQGT